MNGNNGNDAEKQPLIAQSDNDATKASWFSQMLSAMLSCCNTEAGDEKVEWIIADRNNTQPVPFTSVRLLRESFWGARIETNNTVSVPFALLQCFQSNRVRNFEAAAATLSGNPIPDYEYSIYPFDDTDVYKVIEAAAFSLSTKHNPALDSELDKLIEKISAAQEPDGYIYTARTFNPQHPHRQAGPERWSTERESSHELYCLGHLFEAAVAHHEATAKNTLLEIAIKAVNLLDNTFGPGKRAIYPGHQIVEMGLVRLYRLTGQTRCLNLAKFFLDCRHPDGYPGASQYNQAHLPVIEQTAAVGHAVRAAYMYTGMADVATLTNDPSYLAAIDRIWFDVVSSKIYITGGIGARDEGESFGDSYELPNATAYNETCASIANVYWNHRLFLLHRDSRYADVLERTLYNALLAGVSLDGKSFFYPNPLESFGGYQRSPWFGCACCPGNITRFLASISGYQYAVSPDTIFVDLYMSGTATIDVTGDKDFITVSQETNYPWDGLVCVKIAQTNYPKPLHFSFRIPGWARKVSEVFPGDLYSYVDSAGVADTNTLQDFSVTLNGESVAYSYQADGSLSINRIWSEGDGICFKFPMPIRRITSNQLVADNINRVAFQRGPIVYCLESVDNEDVDLHSAVIDREDVPVPVWRPDLLGGVVILQFKKLVAIPYYTWSNRGDSRMNVWIREKDK
ncbi:hypothetical protein HK100_008478 [Physocladia obscura]|uniref:Glycoside hydrolase family 127 protein n=1 Tax=Physocladia obscura TaxID=109957 RepID=A0AAD5T4N5_9FUNG|nr:hypothetical protein HK100_008478 [Physocladia obscura]